MAAQRRLGLAAAALLCTLAVYAVAQQAEEAAALEARLAELRAAAAARPADFEAVLELGATLHQLDHAAPNGGRRLPEAAAAYERAAALAPSPAARAYVTSSLGALLLSGGQVEAAIAAMRNAAAQAEGLGLTSSELYVGTLFNLAKAQQQLGRQEESQALMRRVLRLAEGVSGATYLKAWAALRAFSPQELRDMEQCAAYLQRRRQGVDEAALGSTQRAAWHALRGRWSWLDGLSGADQSWIGFGLFHAYQQAGRYDEAWAALAEANALQDAAAPHSPAQDDATAAAILRMFHPPDSASADAAESFYAALLGGAGGHRGGGPRPIFVVGMPRSGSTLLEQILASHPQVWGAGEDTALAPLLPGLLAALSAGDGVQAARVAAVGRQYVEEMAARMPAGRAGAGWFVDKMLRNVWNVGFIAMMLPEACLLHAARHPADTGLSCFAQPFEGRGTPWAANLSGIAHQIQLVQQLADHWDAVLPGRVLHVRYEDLVFDQEGTTRAVLRHCNIPWDPAVLAFHRTQRTVATASLAQVRQRLYSDSVLRYRQYARHLAPLLRPLRPLILRYEREAGLDSSEALLAAVLDGASGGEGGGGGGTVCESGDAQQQQRQQDDGSSRSGGRNEL